jgi:cell division protein FtsL
VRRVNFILLFVLVACALSLVGSQHKARKLFGELQCEQQRAQELDVEWGQLQLEQSTWATHARIEEVARRALAMRLPDSERVRMIAMPARDEVSNR